MNWQMEQTRTLRALRCLGLALAGVSIFSIASSQEEEFAALKGPVEVELHDGRTHRGRPVSFRDGVLYLREELMDGQVDRGFPAESVRVARFPGAEVETAIHDLLDKERWAEAVPMLEALWRHRAPFLPLLDDHLLGLLYRLPEVQLLTGRPSRAIALAEELLPYANEPSDALALQGVALLSYYELQLFAETERLARDWINEQGRFPRSALGWKVLAELALREEDYDRAAWTSLQPVAFAGPFPIEYLEHCYAIGVLAYHELEQTEQAATLSAEMQQLRLEWPEEDRFADLRDLYEPGEENDAGDAESLPEDDLDLRPAEEDLNLPLQEVRKLVGGPD